MAHCSFLRKWTALLTACLLFAQVFLGAPVFADEPKSQPPAVYEKDMLDAERFKAQFLNDSANRNLNLPNVIVGLWAVPGVDILARKENSDVSFKQEVADFLAAAETYHINTVYLDTSAEDGTLFPNQELQQSARTELLTIDPVAYFIDEARDAGFYVVCTLDLLRFTFEGETGNFDWLNTSAVDFAVKRAQKFARTYPADGVLLENYYNPATEAAFSSYWNSGSGIGLENELTEQVCGLLDSVSYAMKCENFSLAIGLLCDPVYVNASEAVPEGSKTNAAFQMKTDGHLNLDRLLAHPVIDLLMIDAPHGLDDPEIPLQEVINWWAALAAKRDFILTYGLHNEFLCTEKPGFASPDQMVRQVMAAEKSGYYGGCVLQSLPALKKNPMKSTDALMRHLTQGLSSDLILKDLYMTRPKNKSFVTYNNTVQFTGTSSPDFPLTVNGKQVFVGKEGNFALTYPLKPGINTFTLEHKSTKVTYTVTKKLKIIQSMFPSGNIAGNGGMTLSFSVSAYAGSKCTLLVNGEKISMTELEPGDGEHQDELDRESEYRTFIANYTLPKATAKVQQLGNYQITASFDKETASMKGGAIQVNAAKLPPPEVSSKPEISSRPEPSSKPEPPSKPEPSEPSSPDVSERPSEPASGEEISRPNISPDPENGKITAPPGIMVQLIDTQEDGWVETLETTVLNDYATPLVYYYVPKTYDFVNGKMLTIEFQGRTINYYNLCSGRRVYTIDCKEVKDEALRQKVANNRLNSFSMTVSGKHTLLTFDLAHPVSAVISLEGVDYSANLPMNHTVKQYNPTHLLVEIPYIGDLPQITVPTGSTFERVTANRIIDPESGIRKLQFKLYFRKGKAFSGASSYLDDKGRLVVSVRNKMNITKADNPFGYRLDGVKIGITPGHGGGDIGASGFNGINEVDLNFAVADLTGDYLKSIGAEVVQLPRQITDRPAGLRLKMENARKIKPDILLCPHHNSSSSSTASGTETYYYSPFAQPLAKAINNRIAKAYPKMYGYESKYFNRGDKYSPKYMCRDMRFPAVLIEYGFVNNPKEFAVLSKKENQKLLAEATVLGIIDYVLGQQ